MNELKIFENADFGKVRVQVVNNEPLFCLSDVCRVLDLRQGDVRQRLDKDVVSTQPLETAGGTQHANFVNEDGLYDVILDSRKQEAKKFRKWVTGEVLPSIRKTGGYLLASDNETPEEIMARALLVAQETLKRRDERIMQLERKNAILMHVNATYTATELAKELNLRSAQELNRKLAELGIQYKAHNTWVMYAKYSNLGYEEIKQEVMDNGRVVYHRKFTQMGRDFIVNLMAENNKKNK